MSQSYAVAITGASGAQYGMRLIECIVNAGYPVSVLISKAARLVVATETDYELPVQTGAMVEYLTKLFNAAPDQISVYSKEDWMAPLASGSGAPSAMIVCPCSTGSLSAIATGACNNLIERAADVALKERRQLILVPRETPYSQIHLENMLKLTQMGATVMPASPGFYHAPQSVKDLVDFIVARILDHLDIEQTMIKRWGSER